MKKDSLVINVTAVGSPDRAKPAILGVIFGIFWPVQATFVAGEPLCDVGTTNSDSICGRGATVWCRNPLMSPNNFTLVYLMKIGSSNENNMVC